MDKTISLTLCENSLFDGLTKEQIDGVLPCAIYMIKDFVAGEFMRLTDETTLAIVINGCLFVSGGLFGEEARICKAGTLGEDFAFLPHGAHNIQVTAEKNTKVAFLSRNFFYMQCLNGCDFRETHQQIARNMLRILSDKSAAMSKKIAYLSAPDLKAKIAMYLCELYEASGLVSFDMPLKRDRLADFFSVARPSLSREMTCLRKQGIIDFYRSSVKILDLNTLYAIARSNGKQ